MAGHKRKHGRASPATPPPDRKRVKNSLASSFDAEVRPLIDLVDKLRGYGLDTDINLPAVAVIGDQSAGKSSVLEAISGVQLPRGTGIVTRCPLEMRMKHSQDKDTWKGKIMYKDKHDKPHKEDILDRESVGDLVRKAQDEMTDGKAGISKQLITLEVTSSDVPDLTVIDLPGIARNAVRGQPADIEARIKAMIRDYIERQETIILAVLQCNVDIATCEALKMAKEFDKEGLRTLGVLTKSDLLDKGAETGVMRILKNKDYALSKGYIIVKCRGQEAILKRQSLTEALRTEDSFFKDHSHFSSLKESQWGIPTLSLRLSRELQKHIKKLLPELKKDVHRKLMETEQELYDLGEDPPKTTSEKQHKAHLMVHEFVTTTTEVMAGKRIDDRRFPPKINLLYRDARAAFKELFLKCLEEQPDINDKELKKNLEKEIKDARGREFCNFMGKYELVQSCARKYISKLETPARDCFHKVHETTTDIIIAIAGRCFGKYPDFAEKVKNVIMKTRKQTHNECTREIQGYFSMENLVYSQDITYSRELQNTAKNTAMDSEGVSDLHQQQGMPETDQNLNGVNQALISLKSYCQVVARRLCDLIPMIIQMHVFQKKVKSIQDLLIGIAYEEETIRLIQEDEGRSCNREEIKSRKDRLSKAEIELENI